MIYNDFCREKGCDHYIEWECQYAPGEQPYPHTSCKLVGQSRDIDTYPSNCPFIDEIQQVTTVHGDQHEDC